MKEAGRGGEVRTGETDVEGPEGGREGRRERRSSLKEGGREKKNIEFLSNGSH